MAEIYEDGGKTPACVSFDTEIVVVGLGHAGTAAVRAAREAGADTIGLEQQTYDVYRVTGSRAAHVNSCFLRGRGIADIRAPEPSDAMTETFYRESGEAFDWFTEMLPPDMAQRLTVERVGADDLPVVCFEEENNGVTLTDCAAANLDVAGHQGAVLFFGFRVLHIRRGLFGGWEIMGRNEAGQQYCFRALRGVVLAVGEEPRPDGFLPPDIRLPLAAQRTEDDGLFAAGTCCEGFFPQADPAVCIGAAITLGRAAGLRAAER